MLTVEIRNPMIEFFFKKPTLKNNSKLIENILLDYIEHVREIPIGSKVMKIQKFKGIAKHAVEMKSEEWYMQ